jgi:beta-lactamase regulating signal transducer with metallopeptidase domain
MTTADLLLGLARTNVTASVAILLALALRVPVRRGFGAHVAYSLWLLAPAAALGSLMPAADWSGWPGPVAVAGDASRAWLGETGRAGDLAALWLAGFAANAALALWRQRRFEAAARAGRAGPAAMGVIEPRIVVPVDFAQRFSDEERRLIRAHERAHIDRQDARHNALAVVAVWCCWFNPLAHLALAAFRRDQELACDATVMQRLPKSRRAYAETMLRTQPASKIAVFGCHWLAASHPLQARLEMLARRSPCRSQREFGLVAIATLCAAAFAAAWTAQPPARLPTVQTVILIDLSPPDPQETAWVYRALSATPNRAR